MGVIHWWLSITRKQRGQTPYKHQSSPIYCSLLWQITHFPRNLDYSEVLSASIKPSLEAIQQFGMGGYQKIGTAWMILSGGGNFRQLKTSHVLQLPTAASQQKGSR